MPGATDLTRYRSLAIAGKQVYVGTAEMLTQDSHQRGRPDLYQTDQYTFVVITDSDGWASDVIGRLPWRTAAGSGLQVKLTAG